MSVLPLRESELQRLILCESDPGTCEARMHDRCLAHSFGWLGVHFRAARTKRGYRVPVYGSLGVGWPDLVLVHPGRRRLIFAELKAGSGRVSPAQIEALQVLACVPGVLAVVWTPAELDNGEIMRELMR